MSSRCIEGAAFFNDLGTISHGSPRIEIEDSLCDFISKSIDMNQELFCLLELVRLEYCSTDVMNGFSDVLSLHFYEISASMSAGVRARLVLPNRTRKQFLPSAKEVMTTTVYGDGKITIDVPNLIIAHKTRKCDGNLQYRHAADVTSGSFEKETKPASPHSGAYDNDPRAAPNNAVDLESSSVFASAYRSDSEVVPHTRNKWLC
jgi:hypothetical protein